MVEMDIGIGIVVADEEDVAVVIVVEEMSGCWDEDGDVGTADDAVADNDVASIWKTVVVERAQPPYILILFFLQKISNILPEQAMEIHILWWID